MALTLTERLCQLLASLSIFLAILGTSSSFAQSQPPTPTPTETSQPPQADTEHRNEHAAQAERDAEPGSAVFEVAPTPDTAPDAPQKREKREKESATDWWLTVFTGIVALFTVFLAVCTGLLTCVARRQNQMTRTIERAYVTMSHDSGQENPGLTIKPEAGTATVIINVRNYGSTPADVTDVFLDLAFEALPAPGSYILPPGHQQTRAFLVTQNEFNYHRTFTGLDSNDLFAATEEGRKLWLYGYVDYRDSFGTRHRGGYMRRYERFDHTVPSGPLGMPPERDNNLVFDATRRFNYDRLRKRGEGNDWDEE